LLVVAERPLVEQEAVAQVDEIGFEYRCERFQRLVVRRIASLDAPTPSGRPRRPSSVVRVLRCSGSGPSRVVSMRAPRTQ
jgi:hypothetical protein